MSSASASIPGIETLGLSVPLSEIDRRLSELFLVDDQGQESGVTRASVMNLALYTENTETLAKDSATVAQITRESACRSILICVDPTQTETGASAWVDAHCQMDRAGNKSVCSEQISFVLTGSTPGLVRSTVFSHLDSDLPLVFWWKGEFSDAFEERLFSQIDRLVFDSERWGNPRNQFLRLHEALDSGHSHFRFHDLAFTRLNARRQAISNVFDMPALGNKVKEIEGMKISYPRRLKMSAIYLAAWFASRLEANLDRDLSGNGLFTFHSSMLNRQEFVVSLEENETENEFDVSIKVDDLLIECTRCPEKDFMRTRVFQTGEDESSRTMITEDWLPTPKKSDAELVIEILERGGRNRFLATSLAIVGEMITV